MQKRWRILPFDPDQVEQLEAEAKIPTVVAMLLLNRGIDRADAISSFIDTKLSGLRDPENLPGIPEASALIYQAVQDEKKILIYGDYDADGMTASAILYRCLNLLHANVAYFAPNRMSDGYGLSANQIKRHHDQGFEFIISVDCGIANADEIAVAKELGMQVIVTDHHEFADCLPDADAIVHPRLPETDYPFGGLCGAAVALKLAWALCKLDSEATRVKPAHRDFLMMAVGIAAMAGTGGPEAAGPGEKRGRAGEARGAAVAAGAVVAALWYLQSRRIRVHWQRVLRKRKHTFDQEDEAGDEQEGEAGADSGSGMERLQSQGELQVLAM